jgi:hypothetical protein
MTNAPGLFEPDCQNGMDQSIGVTNTDHYTSAMSEAPFDAR